YAAAAGDAFTVRLIDTGGSLTSTLQVYDPQGRVVPAVAGSQKAVNVLSSPGGAYTVLVSDDSRTARQGTFTVQALSTKGGCGSNPAAGRSVRGLVSGAAPFSAYVFSAEAQDRL